MSIGIKLAVFCHEGECHFCNFFPERRRPEPGLAEDELKLFAGAVSFSKSLRLFFSDLVVLPFVSFCDPFSLVFWVFLALSCLLVLLFPLFKFFFADVLLNELVNLTSIFLPDIVPSKIFGQLFPFLFVSEFSDKVGRNFFLEPQLHHS